MEESLLVPSERHDHKVIRDQKYFEDFLELKVSNLPDLRRNKNEKTPRSIVFIVDANFNICVGPRTHYDVYKEFGIDKGVMDGYFQFENQNLAFVPEPKVKDFWRLSDKEYAALIEVVRRKIADFLKNL